MSKLALMIFCLLAICSSLSNAQQDGRYRTSAIPTTKRLLSPALGRYNPNKNDGRYYPSDDGKYRGNDDGKYRPSDEGKYAGKDDYDGKKNKKPTFATRKIGTRIPQRNNFGRMRPTARPLSPLSLGSGTSIGRNDFKILYLYNQEENDGYHYIYQTENGISAEEEGHIVELSTGEGLRAKGYFEYTGDDGSLYRVDYVADDAGFVPQGAHLPPTPPHVVKLLEYLALNAKK